MLKLDPYTRFAFAAALTVNVSIISLAVAMLLELNSDSQSATTLRLPIVLASHFAAAILNIIASTKGKGRDSWEQILWNGVRGAGFMFAIFAAFSGTEITVTTKPSTERSVLPLISGMVGCFTFFCLAIENKQSPAESPAMQIKK